MYLRDSDTLIRSPSSQATDRQWLQTLLNTFSTLITMPRPKVPAHQRQRAAEACNFCREAKKKCSGISPCNYCLRRGSGSSCVMSSQRRNSTTTYDTNIPGSAPSSAPAPAPATFLLERPSPIAIAISALSQGDDRDFQPLSPSESRTTDGDVAGPGSLPRQPSPRMLRSLRGERGR